MFDIGAGEFIALGILAMIVLGPEKLPRYAAEAARMLRKVRAMAGEARSEVRRELGPEFDGVSLRSLNPRTMVRQHLLDPLEDDGNGSGPRRSAPRSGSQRDSGAPDGSVPRYDLDAT